MKSKKHTKLREWQQAGKNGGVCPQCNINHLILTVDHIIPVHILQGLGLIEECSEWEENFSLVCDYCNKFKTGRLDIRNQKTIPLLEKAIAMAKNKRNDKNRKNKFTSRLK